MSEMIASTIPRRRFLKVLAGTVGVAGLSACFVQGGSGRVAAAS